MRQGFLQLPHADWRDRLACIFNVRLGVVQRERVVRITEVDEVHGARQDNVNAARLRVEVVVEERERDQIFEAREVRTIKHVGRVEDREQFACARGAAGRDAVPCSEEL